jgi:RND family efflux transporter MFP subunit
VKLQLWAPLIAIFVSIFAGPVSANEGGVASGGAALENTTPLPLVRTVVLSDIQPVSQRQFYGRVEGAATVDLAFEVGGRIHSIDAPEGTVVSAGQVIAQLDQAPLERAVRRAELTLEQAVRDFERAEALAERSVVSDVQVDDARTSMNLTEVALQEALEALADSSIVAPFDALIADRMSNASEFVPAGQTILRVHDMSETRIVFDLPERILAEIGDPSAIAFTAMVEGVSDLLPLQMREIRLETGPVGQSYSVSLAVVGAAPAMLLPGRSALVLAELQGSALAPVIPPEAIVSLPSGEIAVFAIEEAGDRISTRHVLVEPLSTTGGALHAEGINVETEIVSVGAHLLSDGQSVARFDGLTAGAD